MARTLWIKSCCLLLFVISECLTTKITRLEVPSEVELDDSDLGDLVLDCEYELESQDGLVVTWYFNDEKIYQWIMGNQPTAKQSLKEHLQLGYNISDVPSEQYRALRLINPDKSFSGEYTCKVSTFFSEDSQKQHLQFYDTGDELRLTYSVQVGNDTDSESDNVLVQCDVDGIFPQPEITLTVDGETMNQTAIHVETDDDNGGYNSTAIGVLRAAELSHGAQLRCEFVLPHTSYNYSETISYTGGAVFQTRISSLLLTALTTFLMRYNLQISF